MRCDKNGRTLSEGRKLLTQALCTLTGVEVSRILGVSACHVSELLGGRTRPSLALALKIEKRFGVPCEAWLADAQDQTTD